MSYEDNYEQHPRSTPLKEGAEIPERKFSFPTQGEREAWEKLEANVRPGFKSDIGIQLEADEEANKGLKEAAEYLEDLFDKEDELAINSQVGGDHYKKMGEYQPWIVASKWLSPEELQGFMKGTVIAYLAREDDKGGRKDIEKAMHTIQLYLELSDGES